MAYEEGFYSLPYMVPNNRTLVSRSHYYCAHADFTAIDTSNETEHFRLTSNETLDSIHSICQSGKMFTFVLTCITLALGVPGNSIAIATMAIMPKSTGTFYILVLAVSDLSVVLSTSIKNFFEHYGIATFLTCELGHFVVNTLGIYANWILVLISVERFVTVRFPLKKRFYFTMRRARISAVLLAVCIIPTGFVFLVSFRWDGETCLVDENYEHFYTAFFVHFVNAVIAFLPAALIFLFCILVAVALKKHREEREHILLAGKSQRENSVTEALQRQQLQEFQKMETTLTIMMFFSLLFFVAVSIPICVIMALIYSDTEASPIAIAEADRRHHITKSLYLLSRALNFYIYFLSARKFRGYLFDLLKKCSRSKTPPQDVTAVTEIETT